MGNISGKIWGQTELVFANSNIEFHRIDIKKGGTCSNCLLYTSPSPRD